MPTPRPPRTDGKCPRCGLRPRHVTASGTLTGYCLPCLKDISRTYRQAKAAEKRAAKPKTIEARLAAIESRLAAIEAKI